MNKTSLKYEVVKKKNCWIAKCPQIKTIGYSKISENEAIKDLLRGVKIFFEVHIERGSLDRALKHFKVI